MGSGSKGVTDVKFTDIIFDLLTVTIYTHVSKYSIIMYTCRYISGGVNSVD